MRLNYDKVKCRGASREGKTRQGERAARLSLALEASADAIGAAEPAIGNVNGTS